MRGPACGLSQQVVEVGGSRSLDAQVEVGAAPTTPGRASTARWPGPGKRDGEVYECRNQWWNPLKKSGPALNLVDGRDSSALDLVISGRDSLGAMVAPGATVKCCGVTVDRPAGEKLGAYPV